MRQSVKGTKIQLSSMLNNIHCVIDTKSRINNTNPILQYNYKYTALIL